MYEISIFKMKIDLFTPNERGAHIDDKDYEISNKK